MSRHRAPRLRWIDDESTWDRFIDAVPHAVAHRYGYQRALGGMSGPPPALLVVEDRAMCVASPVLTRKWADTEDIYTPYGFSGFIGQGEVGRIRRVLTGLACERWVAGYFQQHPVVGAATVSLHDGPTTFVVDLDQGWDAVERGMSSRLRTKLRRWARTTTPIRDRECLQRAFLDLYPLHTDRVNAASVYRFSSDALAALAALPEVRLYGAGTDGIEAVVLFGATPFTADYLFGVSTVAGRSHSAGLIARALQDAAEDGIPRANLGGGIHGYDGVAEFKRRFGARPVRAPALSWVFAPETYDRLCRRAGVRVDDPAYFPAYRAKLRA